ncbi:MAG TPA: PAS domain S-box protein, partial [Ardenticatenaceae bacterium]|nr:PAS domain S-box protein [Ardenticatenaceae bacterium]
WLADPNFWTTVVHAEDRERVLALYNRTAADGMDHNLEYRAVTADGRVIWIHDVVNVIRDERDRPRELRGLMVEVTERRRAARRLAVQYRLSQVLAQAAALDTAAPLMLQEIGEGLGMDLGTLWWVDRRANVLRCTAVWRSPGTVAAGFEEASRAAEFPPGKGLPGRVWAEGEPVWIAELLVDTNFARLKAAADAGQRAAFAFPVRSGDEFLGVVEFFRGAIRRPDEDLLTVVAALGNQIGQFVERKRAEDALRTSEGRKAAILATALDGIITIDAEGRILEFNPAAEAIFGYRRDEVLNQQMADLIIPASLRERHAAGMRRYLATGHTSVLGLRFETVAKRKGGGEFPVELAITRIPVDGPPVFTGFIRDITQRRQAEERLRETNATLQALIQASPLASVVLDPDGSVQLWNPAAERIFGWSEEEVLEHPHPVVVENQKDEFRAMLDTVVAGEAFTGREAQRHRRDGAIVDVSIAAAPLYDSQGGVRAVMAVFADVTERRRAEARLSLLAEASTLLAGSLDAETTLKSVARVSVPQLADWCIAYLLDDDGAVRRVAMEYVDPASEILARTIWEEHTLDPRARVGVPQVLRSGLPEFHADASAALLAADVQQPDQLEALLEPLGITSWMCVPLLARGRTLGAISFVSTASGRHYDLDDLALAEELARGAALAVDNARLYQEAQDAVRTRDVFLSVASHELKTPLTALQGYTELLMRRANREGGSNSRDERALKAIHDQAVRLHKLIELLLDLSRIQTGQLEIERGPVDLCSVARRLVEAIEPTLDEHTIQFSCAGEPLVVVGDELRLEQVFQNLLQNAIKYSPDGGPITVSLERRGDQVCLAVADQGIGIPREALSQLFTRFYRAKNVGYRRISGMGLGLYVVKEIVTVLGGEIDVTSQEGQGSTFTVCLPLLASEVSSA